MTNTTTHRYPEVPIPAGAAVAAVIAATVVALLATGTARADDSGDQVTRDACTGFNLGMTPDQIVENMSRNNPRLTPTEAQREILWPIIAGDSASQVEERSALSL